MFTNQDKQIILNSYPKQKVGRTLIITQERICIFLLLISPILGIYSTPIEAISWGEVILVLVCLFLMGSRRDESLTSIKKYFIFIAYAIVSTLLMSFSFQGVELNSTIKDIVSFIVYAFVAIYLHRRINRKLFVEMYVVIAYIFSIFLIFQFIVHLLLGIWIIPIIPNARTDGVSTNNIIQYYSRASSFFKEPAHYAQYMAIPLVYLIFNIKHGFRYLSVILVAMLCTFSGNGVAIILVAFSGFVISRLFSGKVNYFAKGLLIAVLGLGVGFYILMNTEFGADILFRLTSGELRGEYAARNSGYIRIFRGYAVFAEFGLLQKLFGVGLGNYTAYAVKYAFTALTSKTSFTYRYLNGIQTYLTQNGIVGLTLYLSVFLHRIKERNACEKTVIAMFIVLSLISGLDRSIGWIYFMILILTPAETKIFENYF